MALKMNLYRHELEGDEIIASLKAENISYRAP